MILTTIVFLSIFCCTIITDKKSSTVETVSLPVTNKTIVIDAGHGIPDERSTKQYTEQQRHKQI